MTAIAVLLERDSLPKKIILYSSAMLAFLFLAFLSQRYGLDSRDFWVGVGMIIVALVLQPFPQRRSYWLRRP